MKTTVMIMALGLATLASCSKADEVLEQNSQPTEVATTNALATLPESARAVVNSFRSYTVTRTMQFREASERGSLFESTLVPQTNVAGGYINIEFDASGLWTDVEIENGALPHDFIASLPNFPLAIVDYIRTNSLAVEEIERKSYGFKLDMTTGANLLFDKKGSLMSNVSSGGQGAGTTPTPDPVPQTLANKAKEFTARHFSGYNIVYTKAGYDDGRAYTKFYLQQGYRNSYTLVYDAAGNLVEIDGDEDYRLYVPQGALSDFLPAKAVASLKQYNLAGVVTEVELEGNRYIVDTPSYELYYAADGTYLGNDD